MSIGESRGTAIVTGASQGIGAVYARRLAERGHDVVLVARNERKLRDNASAIRAATSRAAEVVVADLSSPADVTALAARLGDDSSISLLVNNAGVSVEGGLLADPDAVARLIALNVTAPTLLAQAAARAFIARGRGAIVNISSVTAFLPEMFNGAYSGSKSYILGLTLNLAAVVQDSDVRVQVVLPGPTNTDMWARGSGAKVIPADKVMEPEDLVDAALIGFDRGEIVTAPTIEDPSLWQAYEAARRALGPQLVAGRPAARYRTPAPAL